MFTVSVRDHIMIAHSFQGDVFGPAQRLHGATYVVDVAFFAPDIDKDGIVIDIGWATTAVGEALAPLRYQNLDEVADFKGVNTTTEFIARDIFQRMQRQLKAAFGAGTIAQLPERMKVTLHESHAAFAAYEAAIEG